MVSYYLNFITLCLSPVGGETPNDSTPENNDIVFVCVWFYRVIIICREQDSISSSHFLLTTQEEHRRVLVWACIPISTALTILSIHRAAGMEAAAAVAFMDYNIKQRRCSSIPHTYPNNTQPGSYRPPAQQLLQSQVRPH